MSPFQQHIKSPVHPLSVHNISLSTQQIETPQRSENKVMIAQPSVQQAGSPAFMPRKSHIESPIRGPAKPVFTDDQPTDLSLTSPLRGSAKAVVSEDQPTDLSLPAPLTEALDLSIPSPKKEMCNPVQVKDNSQSSKKIGTAGDKGIENEPATMQSITKAGKSDDMLENYLAL